MDFERRLAVEREIEKNWDYKLKQETGSLAYSTIPTVSFDETDNFIFFGSLMGIKIVNVRNKTLAKIVGKVESTERFI